MVLHLKVRKSRSPPGPHSKLSPHRPSRSATDRCDPTDAGWSSPVARQAHNLKVVGSNPTPATTSKSSSVGQTDRRGFGAAKGPDPALSQISILAVGEGRLRADKSPKTVVHGFRAARQGRK